MIKLNIPLSDKEFKKFSFIKETLEAEREIHPSDYDSIAMLVVNMSMLEDSLTSIRKDGAIIYSETKYGTVPKSNPANEIAAKANVAIKGYFEQLLMTPKSKALINKALVEKEVEEEDLLTAAFKARNSKRG